MYTVENPGEGAAQIFDEIPGGSMHFGHNYQAGSPILVFIAFLITSFLKICLGDPMLYPIPPYSPPPTTTTVCIFVQGKKKVQQNGERFHTECLSSRIWLVNSGIGQ
jgi:hypothetical protein